MIRTFIRTEPGSDNRHLAEWEEKLLVQIYDNWPRCTELMTDKTAAIIYNAIGSEVEDGLQHIKATYRKRKYSQNIKLRTADFAAKGFNPSEEILLDLMYQYWPRRIATLTPTCKEILTTAIEKDHPELTELVRTRLDFVYTHRKFRRGYFELPNKPGMTEEEETIIDNIYKHWPSNASGMNYHVATFLSLELKLPPETIKKSFKYRRWSRKSYLKDMRTRVLAATVAGRLDLLQYYIEQGDDINAKDSEGLTLLMVCDSYDLKCFEYLLTQSTLDLTLTNNKGQNVMIHICANCPSTASDQMQRLLQWNNSHGHILDINSVDNTGKSMLFYACDTSKRATIRLILKEPTLRINQLFFGKTILRRQCEQQRSAIIKILLTHSNIDVSDSISITNDRALVNIMIKKQIASQSSQSSSSSSSSTILDVAEKCGHYSMDQGRTGICYILSVITLFRNAPEIMEELKSIKPSKTIQPIIKLLSDDYSTYDFSKQCPKIPPNLIQAITNNRVTRRGALTKNGGSAFTLLLYILNIIDIETDIIVRIYHENNNHMSEKQMTTAVQYHHQTFTTYFSYHNHRLGYIDLGTQILLLPSFFVNLRVLMEQCLDIRGFVFRVYGHGINHVIAASVCEDRSIHICNSWGKGCQTDFSEFVNDMTDWGAKTLTIDNIAFLLYKPRS